MSIVEIGSAGHLYHHHRLPHDRTPPEPCTVSMCATGPPLFNPCNDKGERFLAGNQEMDFRFTVPGLYSKYALQSSSFLKIQHTVCSGFVPRLYLLGYRPMEERADPDCNTESLAFMGCAEAPDAQVNASPLPCAPHPSTKLPANSA